MAHATVKFAKDSADLLDILAIPFGGPISGRDTDGETFTPSTNLHLDWYAGGTMPLLYHHGFDPTLKADPIGRVDVSSATMEDDGWWVRAQLDKAHQYYRQIKELIEREALGASSQALGTLTRYSKTGEILEWPWVELTLTPSPANLYATVQPAEAAKTYKAAGLQTVWDAAVKGAIAPKGTATTDAAWDAGAAWKNAGNASDKAAAYRAACAWMDTSGPDDERGSYAFIHHEVSADGTVGAANLTACSTGIGVLNGGRVQSGDSTPWKADKAGIHAHLARHLTDAGKEAPPLKSAKQYGDDAPDGSYEALADTIEDAYEAQQPSNAYVTCVGTFPDYAILRVVTWPTSGMGEPDETYYRVPYRINPDGSVALVGAATEVEEQTTYVPAMGKAARLLRGSLKVGRRNSATDAKRIQQMHDLSNQLGASCDGMGMGGKSLRDRAAALLGALDAYAAEVGAADVDAAYEQREWLPGVIARVGKCHRALDAARQLATERDALHPRGLLAEFRSLEARMGIPTGGK